MFCKSQNNFSAVGKEAFATLNKYSLAPHPLVNNISAWQQGTKLGHEYFILYSYEVIENPAKLIK